MTADDIGDSLRFDLTLCPFGFVKISGMQECMGVFVKQRPDDCCPLLAVPDLDDRIPIPTIGPLADTIRIIV